jgi:hypothetical protein
MGISAGGYLGGKLTRSPGPVLRNIASDKDSYVITAQGENLSSEADFFIDHIKLPIDPKTTQDLVTPTPQEQASDRTFCSELKIKINPIAGPDLSTGDHMFRITNKDAQFADIPFTADPPAIEEVTDAAGNLTANPTGADPKKTIRSRKSASILNVVGSGFRMGTKARWTPQNATDPNDLSGSSVEFVNSHTLKSTLVPGDPGSGILLVLTPRLLSHDYGDGGLAPRINAISPRRGRKSVRPWEICDAGFLHYVLGTIQRITQGSQHLYVLP